MGFSMGNDMAGVAGGKLDRPRDLSQLTGQWSYAMVAEPVISPFIRSLVHVIGSFNSVMER